VDFRRDLILSPLSGPRLKIYERVSVTSEQEDDLSERHILELNDLDHGNNYLHRADPNHEQEL
jgi:hypothetical protein